MSAGAEVVGYDFSCPEAKTKRIRRLGTELFGAAIDVESGAYRACLRPMTPGGPPIVGASRHGGLVYDTGHGHLGWTLACGTARIAADIVGECRPGYVSWRGRGGLSGVEAHR